MAETFIQSSFVKPDPKFDLKIRPENLAEFSGQRALIERLEVMLSAAKKRGEPLGHCLFAGPPGLGKTTLSHIVSGMMGTKLFVTSGPAIDKAADLAGLLTHLGEGDFLFIDEIHRLKIEIEEYLYPAMEDFRLDLLLDSGPSARTVQIQLNRFTLLAATTRSGLLSSPLRSRFAFTGRLEYYTPDELVRVLERTARLLEIELDAEGALLIAKRARGTPRIANHLLRWVRDFAEIKADAKISKEVAGLALEMLAIDELGLDEMDMKYLTALIEHYQCGPAGLNALSASLGEEPATLEEVVEPFLIGIGFLMRTPRGRVATPLAIEHIRRKLC